MGIGNAYRHLHYLRSRPVREPPCTALKHFIDGFCDHAGVNLRTGTQGAFPSAYAVDVDYTDFDSTTPKVKRERFLLGYMGSVETMWHKGNSVLCQAIRKITERPNCKPQSCILEVSDQGLRMVDRAKSSTMVSERKMKIFIKIRLFDFYYSTKSTKTYSSNNYRRKLTDYLRAYSTKYFFRHSSNIIFF